MRRGKKILLGVSLVFIVMQFIRPARNSSSVKLNGDMTTTLNVPSSVAGILKASCYDCHSNNTRYPWYSNIQPAGWLLAKHIKDGKEQLNFDEFGNYSKRRQLSKLRAVENSIKDGSMPLSSYTWLHPDAKLSAESKALILNWTSKKIDSISTERKSE